MGNLMVNRYKWELLLRWVMPGTWVSFIGHPLDNYLKHPFKKGFLFYQNMYFTLGDFLSNMGWLDLKKRGELMDSCQ